MGKTSQRTTEQRALYKRLSDYRRDRRKKGWQLTNDQAFSLFMRACHYCGSPANPLKPHGIDRVLNDLPYILGNTMTCCRICNRAKGNMTTVEFVNWIKQVHATVTSPAFLQNTNIGLAAQSGTLRVHMLKDGMVRTATTRGMTTKEEAEQS
jgi:hypothetical protein